MNRYKGPTVGGPSKATASTTCQKCLKKDRFTDIFGPVFRLTGPSRHYSYECKAVAQERPYVSRPSRTQQLLNPKLVPKLTSDVPQDLLRKNGIADEELEKKELERGRKRDRENDGSELKLEKKRARSTSSQSSTSATAISREARSSLPLPEEILKPKAFRSPSLKMADSRRKRRHSSTASEDSYMSDHNQAGPQQLKRTGDRSTRKKFNEFSPIARGRRRSRTPSRGRRPSLQGENGSPGSNQKARETRSRSRSHDGWQSSSVSTRKQTNPRVADRASDHGSYQHKQQSSTRSGSQQFIRNRDQSFSTDNLERQRYSDEDERNGMSSWKTDRYERTGPESGDPPRMASSRGRSISPFSKRVALTQSMRTEK